MLEDRSSSHSVCGTASVYYLVFPPNRPHWTDEGENVRTCKPEPAHTTNLLSLNGMQAESHLLKKKTSSKGMDMAVKLILENYM